MDVSVGQKATREMTVTEEMVAAYAELTGDRNPLHFDAEFAAGTRFKRLIAQGGITTGLLHALVAMDMPGAGSVFLNQSWNFPKPVYIGDTIRAEATVRTVHDRRGIVKLDIVIENQDGDAVLSGEATVMQVEPGA
ncbi:MAG: MaoC family dehydratase [Chloroflexi bacterium]|nr:MaoC family dehydratase [Chloroflexota bacterium]